MNPTKQYPNIKVIPSVAIFLFTYNFLHIEAVQAQTTAAWPDSDEEIVELSPFEVTAERDFGYIASDSNSIARFRTDLQTTPVSTDIMTSDFLDDIALTTIEDALAEYGAGAGQIFGSPELNYENNQPGDRSGNVTLGVRGLNAGKPKRDGFANAPVFTNGTSTFDIERVEVVRGPSGGMLFGASGAGGSVYSISKQARFRKFSNKITFRIDQYGSKYALLDTNIGTRKVAVRASLVTDDTFYRRIFLNNQLKGAYVQLALSPFKNTIIRLSKRYTSSSRILATSMSSINFTNATKDPRHLMNLSYLLASGKIGATDPETGEAYPSGVVGGSIINWANQQSLGGWTNAEDLQTNLEQVTVDTVWTRWLSTSFGYVYNDRTLQSSPDGGRILPPTEFNVNNPFSDAWANGSLFRINKTRNRSYSYRAAALLKIPLFGGKVQTQTSFGFNYGSSDSGVVNYRFYLSDENGNIKYDKGSANADALGRVSMPTLYWSLKNGPVKQPYFKMGTEHVVIDGSHYARSPENPRSPEWISPLNPLGLASLVDGVTGITGSNENIYDSFGNSSYGYYVTNFSSWFDNKISTLAGWRTSVSNQNTPNVSANGTEPYDRERASNVSYGVGISYAVRQGLNLFYNYARSFESPTRGDASDPLGNLGKRVDGTGQELGAKLSTKNRRYAISVQYYTATSENERNTFTAALRNLVNPVGINGFYIGPSGERGTWVSVDKNSSGLEVILTANPTRNWSVRLAATSQNGKLHKTVVYPILWNDEFYYDKTTGGVTYANGDTFMVPTDSAGILAVSRLRAESPPVAGTANTQLTLAMLAIQTATIMPTERAQNKHPMDRFALILQHIGHCVGSTNLWATCRMWHSPGVPACRSLTFPTPLMIQSAIMAKPSSPKKAKQRLDTPSIAYHLLRTIDFRRAS